MGEGVSMERLTIKNWRNLDPWEMCGQDNYCKRGCHDQGGCTKGCIVPRIYGRLAAYEDTGLAPEEIKVHEAAKYNAGYYHGDEDRCRWIEKELGPIDHLRDLLQAEQDGRLVKLPFVAMVEQSLQDGKMKPMGDQKHNGRYAVVYVDHNKWKSPLIDICGKPYNREEAENRMAALALKGGDG